MTSPGTRFRDFTPEGEPTTFKIGDDTFVCVQDMDIDELSGLVELANGMDVSDTTRWREQLTAVAQVLLEPSSAKRFVERIQPLEVRKQVVPPTPGIGIKTITSLVPCLVEEFGLVPTQPSSGSLDGSPDDGTGSTGGPLATE